MKSTTLLLLPLLILAAAPGCIAHKSTVYHDVSRMPVEFESDAAARLFYETLSKDSRGRNQSESTTEFSLPIVFSHERTVKTGPNAAFNEAVSICDSNKDGRITELEAKIFANRR